MILVELSLEQYFTICFLGCAGSYTVISMQVVVWGTPNNID